MKFLYIAWKDFILVLRDKKALLVLVAMPIILTSILGFALEGIFSTGNNGITKVNIAVVKGLPDENPPFKDLISPGDFKIIEEASKDLNLEFMFINDFLEKPEIKRVISYKVMDEKTSQTGLGQKTIDAVVFLPGNFSTDYIMGKNIVLKVATNTSAVKNSVVVDIIKGFTDAISMPRIGLKVLAGELVSEGMGRENTNIAGEEIKELMYSPHVQVDFYNYTEKGREVVSSVQYYGAAMGVMFILFAAGLGVNSIVEEREEMTMGRLILSGGGKWQIVAGKALGISVIALAQMAAMIVFTGLVFGIGWGGDRIALILLTVSAVYAVAGLGILVGSLVRSKKGAEIFQILVIQLMALLGGSFMPIYVMPDMMKAVSGFTINGQALAGYLRLMEGAGLNDITGNIVVLAAMGTAFLAVGGAALKMEQGR